MHRQRRQQLLRRLSRQVRHDAAGGLGASADRGARQQRLVQPSGSRSTGTEPTPPPAVSRARRSPTPARTTRTRPSRVVAPMPPGTAAAAPPPSGCGTTRRRPQRWARPTPAPNAKGWLRSPVTVAWSGSDTTSGVASCSSPSGYSGPDTAGATLGGSCTDNAGNSSNGSYTVKYDTHPPATTAAPTRGPERRRLVPRARDDLRPAAPTRSPASTPVARPPTAAPTRAGTSTSVTCTDNAGNSSSDAYLVKYDATPPAVSGADRRTGARQQRLVQPPGPDRLARNRRHLRGRLVLVAHLRRARTTRTRPSRAAAPTSPGTAAATPSLWAPVRRDAALATVTAARPADHDGWYNHPVSISWSGTDATSGIDSCTAPLTYSGPDNGNASSVGGCTDHAGNTASPPALSFRYDATPPSATAAAVAAARRGRLVQPPADRRLERLRPRLRDRVLQLLRLRRPGRGKRSAQRRLHRQGRQYLGSRHLLVPVRCHPADGHRRGACPAARPRRLVQPPARRAVVGL